MGLSIMSDCRCGTYSAAADTLRASRPDPQRFTVLRTRACGAALVTEVQYEGCTNYEGHKILVYDKMSNAEFLQQTHLDPHFCDNPQHPSPIARFEPTQRGWALALALAALLTA